jgi:hypothetical protein
MAILLTIVMATLLLAIIATAAASVPQDIAWRQQGAMAHFNVQVPSTTPAQFVTIDVVAAQQMALGSGDDVVYLKITHPNSGGTSERTYTTGFDSWSLSSAEIILTNVPVDFGGAPSNHDIVITWQMTSATTDNTYTDSGGHTISAPGQWRSGNTGAGDKATISMYDAKYYHKGTGAHAVFQSDWAALGEQTRPIIGSCNLAGTYKSSFGVGENVFAQGTGYGSSQSYNAYVVRDTTWKDNLDISSTDVINTVTVNSDPSGVISATQVYTNAQPGLYDIVVDINHNGKYDVGVDALCDNIVLTGGFFVVPEYALGGALLALVSCFAAFAVIHRRDTHPKLATL